MHAHFGPQHWWPADSPFEVCLGAILTQNTNWSNVERALESIKDAGALAPVSLYQLPLSDLEQLLRPAGTFRVKARRLRAFLKVLVEDFAAQLPALFQGATKVVRRRLLDISGIGPETADCMLLYASNHESFVIDAYTRRVFARHGWATRESRYLDLQRLCETGLAAAPRGVRRLELWRDAHAQFVMVAKRYCRSRTARCTECPLRPLLPDGFALPT
jgi:endonuclease-3 related protein